jgi:gluconate 2-dehydrogenase gamma chain
LKEIGVARRRFLLASISLLAVTPAVARAESYSGSLPWRANADGAPQPVDPAGWTFFIPEEVAVIDALVNRLIPADDLSPGGKDLGITVYIDRQLSGGFGQDQGLYMSPPFQDGLPGQGPQGKPTPAQRYRASIASLEVYCRHAYAGKHFAELAADEQDKLIGQMESNTLQLPGVSSKAFFQLLWQNTKEGFFADPVYGGNKNMAGWRMIGFPGARYDYRDWVEKHNQPYPLPPVGIQSHPDWS